VLLRVRRVLLHLVPLVLQQMNQQT
jgi:hypothetical protein